MEKRIKKSHIDGRVSFMKMLSNINSASPSATSTGGITSGMPTMGAKVDSSIDNSDKYRRKSAPLFHGWNLPINDNHNFSSGPSIIRGKSGGVRSKSFSKAYKSIFENNNSFDLLPSSNLPGIGSGTPVSMSPSGVKGKNLAARPHSMNFHPYTSQSSNPSTSFSPSSLPLHLNSNTSSPFTNHCYSPERSNSNSLCSMSSTLNNLCNINSNFVSNPSINPPASPSPLSPLSSFRSLSVQRRRSGLETVLEGSHVDSVNSDEEMDTEIVGISSIFIYFTMFLLLIRIYFFNLLKQDVLYLLWSILADVN